MTRRKVQVARAITIAGTGALLGLYGIAGLADHGGGPTSLRTVVSVAARDAAASPSPSRHTHKPKPKPKATRPRLSKPAPQHRRAQPPASRAAAAPTRSSVAVKATRT